MDALEKSAANTIIGLARQLLDLDYEVPAAFGQALSIGAEIERVAGQVVAARSRAEFDQRMGVVDQAIERIHALDRIIHHHA